MSSSAKTLPLEITIGQNTQNPLTVYRLGYGTMRLTGPGIWGEPANREEALQILKNAVQVAGVNFIDTADYYGEDVTNRLIAEALYPYPKNLIICTKVGATRKPDKSWVAFNRPEQLRTSIDNNLRTLKQEQISLVHFRVMLDSDVPFEESIEAMFELQKEGKILHVGLSNVTRDQLELGLTKGHIATVENMYSYHQRTTLVIHHNENRGGEEVLDLCEKNQIPLIPYFSLVTSLPTQNDKIGMIAQKYQVSKAQINLAWLLHKSRWILPIPGTSSLAHLDENLQAANIQLTAEDMAYLG
ncbi:aldo/keto reductase [Mucilaginibacter robiniae]|uniref:Aldo/keto reductase n=1 Tax=Mucilaginibacter robiniae TaxID=2728022 RepID=A0A7L5DZ10_9SPHI|nr:aldo/keto reductase [Mucilaginibacter robiniae]QJD94514.1 aldo/keto reductase [Mucilaginibacter robiniae]